MARADSSLPQDWYADERAKNLEEEQQHFSDADLDEMLLVALFETRRGMRDLRHSGWRRAARLFSHRPRPSD
jgi:hypothetical protein